MDKKQLKEYQKQLRERFFSVQFDNLDCQIKLDFSSNSEKLGMVFDNSKTS